jgi:ATP-dependent Zn protease
MRLIDLDPADQQRALAAAHEAGHAVACEALGRTYRRVTLGDAGGPPRVEAAGLPAHATKDEIEREVLCALAGLLAEALIFKEQAAITTVMGGAADCVAVRRVLGRRARDRHLVDRLLAQALRLVSSNVVAIKRVAKALVAKHELTPSGVREAIGGLTLVGIAATTPDSEAHVP